VSELGVELSVRGSRVLIRAEDQRETTRPSGLIAVSSYAPDVIGTVEAIGDDVREVQAGDVVLFAPEAGIEMDFGGQKYLVLTEDEILAIWDEDQEPV
jgi:co-chaperonin GroES (HSP10)